ncbi:MAG: Uma2 family endonuclease [Candidatus Tectomicrobia bacterium]|uniref:Uma2 family endonuclease n=1 Tax=Tectimicrobiota bacterium TaxID=2528274 RepID=A0A937W476_UNCTE|nr:Uma2 family endonuclease [Candidatus Tectomicrobia bacterium]
MAAVVDVTPAQVQDVYYPESDGQPMADNTKQFEWIVTIKENLDALLPDAFVAGDLFWYPLRGNNRVKQAPDVLVALGRPKGHRSSYLQWEEQNIAPQVVFEVLSPGNSAMDMLRKLQFYDQYGVTEYYAYDPDDNALLGWQRLAGQWQRMDIGQRWSSPLLGIRFELTSETMVIYRPDGSRFETFTELMQRVATEQQEKVAAQAQAEAAQAQAEAAQARAEAAQAQAEAAQAQVLQERQAKDAAQAQAQAAQAQAEAALAQAAQERQAADALRAELARLQRQNTAYQ